jgi:hypothetical protein
MWNTAIHIIDIIDIIDIIAPIHILLNCIIPPGFLSFPHSAPGHLFIPLYVSWGYDAPDGTGGTLWAPGDIKSVCNGSPVSRSHFPHFPLMFPKIYETRVAWVAPGRNSKIKN